MILKSNTKKYIFLKTRLKSSKSNKHFQNGILNIFFSTCSERFLFKHNSSRNIKLVSFLTFLNRVIKFCGFHSFQYYTILRLYRTLLVQCNEFLNNSIIFNIKRIYSKILIFLCMCYKHFNMIN